MVRMEMTISGLRFVAADLGQSSVQLSVTVTFTSIWPRHSRPVSYSRPMDLIQDDAAKANLFDLLGQCRPRHAVQLRDKVRNGTLDGGSTATCIIGWLARFSGDTYCTSPLVKDSLQPIEVWIFGIGPDSTPLNSSQSAKLDTWLTEWIEQHAETIADDWYESKPTMPRLYWPVSREQLMSEPIREILLVEGGVLDTG
jgi:hypothetical protein